MATSTSINTLLSDYYRLPIDWPIYVPSVDSLAESGFFRFGSNEICYGKIGTGEAKKTVAAPLHDAWKDVYVEDRHLHLSFDPLETVRNIRRERYAAHLYNGERGLLGHFLVRKIYYAIRESLPVSVRRQFQKAYLSGWRDLPFPRWPVDFTVDTLHEKFLRLFMEATGSKRMPFIWFWPEGMPSCAIVTHDVEDKAGYSFCGSLMDINDSFGIKSSFQVIPEVRYAVDQVFLDTLRRRGFEVNVHDLNHDGILFREKQEFLRRAKKINEYGRKFGTAGFRSGAMYRNQDWFDAFDFSYDMSVPNVAHLEPQRGGCCTVMPYFIGKILELPLTTIQDYSLFHILGDYSIEMWKKQIDLILRRNGLISFITHPDYLIEARARAVYQELLVHLARMRAERQMWIALPGEVNRWWRSRKEMRLIRDGERWRVEGEGSERARLAYANLEGDSLTYSLEEPS